MTLLHGALEGLRCVIVVFPDHTHLLFDTEEEIFLALNCNYFLTLQFNNMFWVLKRTVSMRHFF